MYRILIVERDHVQAIVTNRFLLHAGYQTDLAGTCGKTREYIRAHCYSLILLNVALPDGNGCKLCREIRKFCSCPIIFVSTLSDSRTIIAALMNGGDDYMVKPINYYELLARIQAHLRRIEYYNRLPDLLKFKRFSIDTSCHEVRNDAGPITLSPTEYGLLLCFIAHPNLLLTYDELYRSVWNSDSIGDIRTVMVHISNLRKKIDPSHTGVIRTIRGEGYLFNDI